FDLRLLSHPGEFLNGLPIRFGQIGNQFIHCSLRLSREELFSINLADAFSQGSLHQCNSALPAGFELRSTGQCSAIEIKVCLNCLVVQVWSKALQHLPLHPCLPALQWLRGEE